jgi:phosphatidylglycerophosphate synthase
MIVRKIWGREPTVWLALIAALVQAISGFFFHLTDEQQGVLNAVAAAVLGFVKALFALGLAFGAHWAPDKQSLVMVLITAVFAAFVRQQVVAPVDSEGNHVTQAQAALLTKAPAVSPGGPVVVP